MLIAKHNYTSTEWTYRNELIKVLLQLQPKHFYIYLYKIQIINSK